MLVQGIKSRPVYQGITLDPKARRHLVVLEAEGALALTVQVTSTPPEGHENEVPSSPQRIAPGWDDSQRSMAFSAATTERRRSSSAV